MYRLKYWPVGEPITSEKLWNKILLKNGNTNSTPAVVFAMVLVHMSLPRGYKIKETDFGKFFHIISNILKRNSVDVLFIFRSFLLRNP